MTVATRCATSRDETEKRLMPDTSDSSKPFLVSDAVRSLFEEYCRVISTPDLQDEEDIKRVRGADISCPINEMHSDIIGALARMVYGVFAAEMVESNSKIAILILLECFRRGINPFADSASIFVCFFRAISCATDHQVLAILRNFATGDSGFTSRLCRAICLQRLVSLYAKEMSLLSSKDDVLFDRERSHDALVVLHLRDYFNLS
jgi:hypothetical protein